MATTRRRGTRSSRRRRGVGAFALRAASSDLAQHSCARGTSSPPATARRRRTGCRQISVVLVIAGHETTRGRPREEPRSRATAHRGRPGDTLVRLPQSDDGSGFAVLTLSGLPATLRSTDPAFVQRTSSPVSGSTYRFPSAVPTPEASLTAATAATVRAASIGTIARPPQQSSAPSAGRTMTTSVASTTLRRRVPALMLVTVQKP